MDETTPTMRILFVTPEIHPLIKTGGLADVGGSLPAALRGLGVDVKVLVPGYPKVLAGAGNIELCCALHGLPEAQTVRLLSATLPGSGVPLLIVDCPALYQRDGGPYQDAYGSDWPDNCSRFALLSRVAALLGSEASPLDFRPDVVHCNDWQSALAPALLHFMPGRKAATITTIHNLAFQGIFPVSEFDRVGLPAESFDIEGVEYYGNFSFLKAGLYYADRITTVSPTYAEEIQREPLGFGMHGLLAQRRTSLSGIVNGIDTSDWNPASDSRVAAPYSAGKLGGKAASKRALQDKFGLAADPDIPLLGIISRITHQKGVDVLLDILPRLLDRPVQFVLLGTGEAELENGFRQLATTHHGQVGITIGFDENLSHLIEAGIDLFLMPSRFEPCGLNQMYSQRYGTPPIVHATGGLADTVVDTNPATLAAGTATGFVFDSMTAASLYACIDRALAVYGDKVTWRKVQRNGMKQDFSWKKSAEDYLALYRSLAK